MTITYDERRQAHITTLFERFPAMLERLTWSAEQLAAHRERELRALVAHAKARSPFHRERLIHIDPATMTEADLATVPTMTKADVMAHFDDIVTDPRITRARAEAHLESLVDGPAHLFDEHHVVATGGSSGSRTIMVWDWDGWADCFISMCRHSLVRGMKPGREPAVAGIAADHPSHMSSAALLTFSNPEIPMHKVPASLPLADIVARLNEIQPETILGYASMIHRLALEADAGRLRISPDKVLSGSEALLPETRALATAVWGITVDNNYASSEAAGIGSSCGRGPWMHLSDDLHVIEIAADRVIVTNLINRVLPLIRYEHDDRTTLLDVECPCGSAHRVIGDVDGRTADIFTFTDGTTIHPIVFSSTIGKERAIAEYQVRQNGDAVDVDVIAHADLDPVRLRSALERALLDAGAHGVKVSVRSVDAIERHGATAKLRRFIPG